MSGPGRSLGRAGRGAVPKKPSSSSFTLPIARPQGRAVKTTKTEAEGPPLEAGEPSQETAKGEVEELVSKSKSLKISDNGKKGETSRGGFRGGRKITAVEIIKTKPETCSSKKGIHGKPVELTTNYFKLETVTDWILYQYRVDFNVQEDRPRALQAYLRQHKDRIGSSYLFDGTMLFISQRLTAQNEPLELTSLRDSDHFPIQITIKFVQQLGFGNYVYLQVFNILVRRCLMHLNLHLVNRNYFDPKESVHLAQHNLEIWPGYVTSIRQHENDILLCAEIAHKVMRTDSALRILQECMQEGGDYRNLYQQTMIGSIVLTDYNNKTYRVDDVDFNSNPMSSFKYKTDEMITYVKYYQIRYQITIKDMRQPLLVSRASARDLRAGKESYCLLIPELCRMTGLSNKMIENRNLMKDLADITRVAPEARIEKLYKFNARLHAEPKVAEDFKNWGMTMSRRLMTVTGRELPPELIIAGKNITYSAGREVDWSRSLRSSEMLHVGKFETFVVICPGRIRRDLEEFLVSLKRAADGMRFRIPRPFIVETKSDSSLDLINAIEGAISKSSPDLIMVALTTDRADRYCAVKKKCYVDRGIPNQVILARSMKSKGVMSIATKVAVQMNCKVKGAPWTVHIPTENVMVLGYDVCHDKNKKSSSVGAVVASLNKTMNLWFSTVSFHSAGEELSNTIAVDITKALMKYKQLNNKLPSKIFFYRDGVGEGQVDHVYHHEVEFLKKRLTEIYGGETWKLAYIIVTKRIHTRFFNGGKNPVPGTIVDDVVTLPERYDFFLVSQSVRQGTVSPTSYNVISDNLDWKPDLVQRFTYKMTHLYYNCSATVAVPAPCQYAHKLAFMVGQNLHTEPHQNLNSSLYFL